MIVLDTHVLIWWINGERTELSSEAAAAIERERHGGEILVSSITAWEISMLVQRGRIALPCDLSEWLSVVDEIEAVRFIPVDNEISVKATELPGEFHKDPADRFIVATARKWMAPIVTADEKIRAYSHVRTIW